MFAGESGFSGVRFSGFQVAGLAILNGRETSGRRLDKSVLQGTRYFAPLSMARARLSVAKGRPSVVNWLFTGRGAGGNQLGGLA